MKEFKLLKRKLISGIIFLTMFASLFLPYFSLNTQAGIDKAITLIACSDFQNPYGNEAGKQNVKQILKTKGFPMRMVFLLAEIMIMNILRQHRVSRL